MTRIMCVIPHIKCNVMTRMTKISSAVQEQDQEQARLHIFSLVDLGKIVHIVIKAPNLVQSCSIAYLSILEGEPPCSGGVSAFSGHFQLPLIF